MKTSLRRTVLMLSAMGAAVIIAATTAGDRRGTPGSGRAHQQMFGSPHQQARQMIEEGQQIFRYDTYGDEAFWSGQLQIHQALAGLSPRQALDLGVKVDSLALPPRIVDAVKKGTAALDDPAVTATLLKKNALLGVVGTFDGGGNLTAVGFTCAICHSTVDDSVGPGVGRRIDGLANRDLNVGAIIASAPNLQPVVDLLRFANPATTLNDARAALLAWGPGKFDAELLLDGKAFQPGGASAATLIPNASGLSGHNLHTWTGGWGTVTYWNAFVANLELRGIGNFYDERLDNAAQFPIAAAAGFGHVTAEPDEDRITSKLPALHFYQLALAAARPRPEVDFNVAAAARGDVLFDGKANCNQCHVEPLWTEPGWNQHSADEMGIDSFQADRSPGHAYRTMGLAGIFVRENGLFMKPENKGRFYHDGRFATLFDVVSSYNQRFDLDLTEPEMRDLVEYLKSL